MSLLITSSSLNRVQTASALAFTLTFIMLFPLFPLQTPGPSLDEVEQRREQFGGGGSLEEQCSSITFEDMFIYDKAFFDIQVDEDWQTAQVAAMAWINWTLADDIRDDLDEYLEGIVPSGGDDWLSTDEVGAVILIAADCLQYSLTRIGIRDGSAHRGGVGVDWKNTTWQNDGMDITEYNGVPPSHAEGRDCQGFNQGDCYEIPVRPSVERDCDTEINESDGADECRVVLWLNATLEIQGVSNPNDFTIAFNSSNMSNAKLDFTFPYIQDLRLDQWEECEGRYVGPDEGNPGGESPPHRGSCIGDGSSQYELNQNEDGSLTYTLFPSLERGVWPYGEDLFADFTTSPIPVDDPPTWTDAAPEDGSWFPVDEDGQRKWASWQALSTWFSDESGVSKLDIDCSAGDTGEISQVIDRSLWVTFEGTVSITCEATDEAGQSSGNRSWYVGVPITVSTDEPVLNFVLLSDPHPFTLELASEWVATAVEVEVGLVQGGQPKNIEMASLNGWAHRTAEIEVASASMLPGDVFVWVRVTSLQGHSMEKVYDFGIKKSGSPPLIAVNPVDWNGHLWRISGQYSDPDGESVTFTLLIPEDDLREVEVTVTGNSWESEWVDSSLLTPGNKNLVLTGCDESFMCTEEHPFIDAASMPGDGDGFSSDEESGGSPIPSLGILSVMMSVFAALMYTRRRD